MLRRYDHVPSQRADLKRTLRSRTSAACCRSCRGRRIAAAVSRRIAKWRDTIMPHATFNGAKLWYEESGQGPQTVVLAHGLAFSGAMFDAQVAALSAHYRCITFDLRGHGKSELSTTGYDMDTLAGDAAALIEEIASVPVHFVGWSIGGFTGLRIALWRPELLRSLTLIGSSAMGGTESARSFKLVPLLARAFGMRALAGSLMKTMFSDRFRSDPSHATLVEKWRQHFLSDEKLGVSRAARGVIARR